MAIVGNAHVAIDLSLYTQVPFAAELLFIMVAIWNRADHYIFVLLFLLLLLLSSYFFLA